MSKLITVEGLDLAGKTSVIIPYLMEKLGSVDYEFVADLRSTSIASRVRDIFMDPLLITDETDWRTIAFLSAAARSDMVNKQIIPALKAGRNVISDRYVDTAFVYNLKSDTAPISNILNLSTHLVYPHITIFAHCSYAEMKSRKDARDGSQNDHWDIAGQEEHASKLERYRDQLNSRSGTVIEIDTSGSLEDVYANLDEIILNHLR